MREAGLTPMQILACTTANGARAFGLSIIGAVEPGQFADLVILNSDPRDDISRASDIHSVMVDGRLYPVRELATGRAAE